MTLKDKVIGELKLNNYQSDRELADKILGKGSLQQPINSVCRQLEATGYLKRTAPPIKNYIDDKGVITASASISNLTTLISESLPHISSVTRGEYLKNEFNSFWNAFFETDRDYYSDFSLEKLVGLKMAVANINNLITYESTLMAAHLICDILLLNEEERAEIITCIETASVNSNGFDIEYKGRVPFICEVKANIPAGGRDIFGAAQIQQLNKDIESLLNGKNKSSLNLSDIQNNFYKFLCLYCDNEKTHKAIKKFVSMSNKVYENKLEFWFGQELFDRSKVYVIFVVMDD